MRLAWSIAALVSCSGALAACNDDESLGSGCYIGDNKGAVTHGTATPDDALKAELTTHPKFVSQAGWTRTDATNHSVRFVSRNDRIDIIRAPDGTWVLGAIHACR